jgi:hypothetical protein
MKKKLFCSLLMLAAFLFTTEAKSQINYLEDFEGDVNWTNPDELYFWDVPWQGCSNVTLITYLWSYLAGYPEYFVSPSMGVSNGLPITLSYTYKISKLNFMAMDNDPAWGTVKIEYANSEFGPWALADMVSPSNHTVSESCTERIATFSIPEGENIHIRFNVEVNPDPDVYIDGYALFDNVTVTQPCSTPSPDEILNPQTLCATATIADLSTDGYDAISWYAAAQGGEPLTGDVVLAEGAYYAAQIPAGGCESPQRTAVAFAFTDITLPEVAGMQDFCTSAVLEDLQATGEGIIEWYDTDISNMPLAEGTALIAGTYYVSQVIDGCESLKTAVTVNIYLTQPPVAASPQAFEILAPATSMLLYDTEVTADGTVKWYSSPEDAQNGENVLPENTQISESGTYYTTQTVNGCESEPFEVVIDVLLSNYDFDMESFTYYPNPVKNVLNISYTDVIQKISVLNLLGQTILEKGFDMNEVQVDLSSLASGTYLVKAETGQHATMIRIIKH